MTGRGRPRGFDRDRALEQALRVFWEHGYQGASMTALTSAMGIKSPSLYAAYGSKEELFREALALYAATEGSYTRRALDEQPTARASVEAALRDNAAAYTDPATPRGCLVILAAPSPLPTARTSPIHSPACARRPAKPSRAASSAASQTATSPPTPTRHDWPPSTPPFSTDSPSRPATGLRSPR